MKISIVGWYGQGNIGDEAFRPMLDKCFYGHEVNYITPPNLPKEDADLIVLGGGAVISPFYLEFWDKRLTPKCCIGVDLAYESEIDLLASNDFKFIMLRNSIDYQQWKYKLHCPVSVIPDLSFYLRPTGKKILNKNKKSIGVFATDYINPAIDRPISLYGEKSFSFIQNLAKELDKLQDNGFDVYIFCCSTAGYGDDRRMALCLSSFMKTKPIINLDTFTPQDMIDLIAELDLTICQRFHAHIFSIIAGTPLVSIAETRKVDNLLTELGIKDKVVAGKFINNKFDTNNFDKIINNVLSDQQWHKRFRSIAANNNNKLISVIKEVRQKCFGELS